jgi:hypothetical protein
MHVQGNGRGPIRFGPGRPRLTSTAGLILTLLGSLVHSTVAIVPVRDHFSVGVAYEASRSSGQVARCTPLVRGGADPLLVPQGCCDGPLREGLDRLAHRKGNRRSICAPSPCQVEWIALCRGITSTKNRPQLCRRVICAGKVRWRFLRSGGIRDERLGLRTCSAMSAATGAAACNLDVVHEESGPTEHRLCSGGFYRQDSSQGAVGIHRFPRPDCAVRSSENFLKTFLPSNKSQPNRKAKARDG